MLNRPTLTLVYVNIIDLLTYPYACYILIEICTPYTINIFTYLLERILLAINIVTYPLECVLLI